MSRAQSICVHTSPNEGRASAPQMALRQFQATLGSVLNSPYIVVTLV